MVSKIQRHKLSSEPAHLLISEHKVTDEFTRGGNCSLYLTIQNWAGSPLSAETRMV